MNTRRFYVYILTNSKNSTLYVGVTSNLERRVIEHKKELLNGFTKKYKLKKLIYFEEFQDIGSAIAREKQLKNWRRQWKLDLIESFNPGFRDFAENGFNEDSETSSE